MKTRAQIESMSSEERRVATAELCGWKFSKIPGEFRFVSICPTTGNVWHEDFGSVGHLPDYLQCLNACHSAEKMLENDKVDAFQDALFEVLNSTSRTSEYSIYPVIESGIWKPRTELQHSSWSCSTSLPLLCTAAALARIRKGRG